MVIIVKVYKIFDAQGDDFEPVYADEEGVITFIKSQIQFNPDFEFSKEESWAEMLEKLGFTFELVYSKSDVPEDVKVYKVKDAQDGNFEPFYADIEGIKSFIHEMVHNFNLELCNKGEDTWENGLEKLGLTYELIYRGDA